MTTRSSSSVATLGDPHSLDIPSLSSTTPVEQIHIDRDVAPASHNNNGDKRIDDAARTIQRLFRCRNARQHLHALLATVFEKFVDADSGLYYYLNKRTGETTWDKPRVLKAHEDIALSPIYLQDPDGDTELLDAEEQDSETQRDTRENQRSAVDDDSENHEDGVTDVDGQAGDALGFTPQERALVQQQFDHYDTDHSGSISAKELHQLLTALGEALTLANVVDLIRSVDANGNGEVEFDEFLRILKNQKAKNQYTASLELAILFGPKELAHLKQQFMKLDLDGSGSIDAHEIEALITKLGRKLEDYDLRAMLREVDADGSGAIGFNEFLHIIASMMKDKDALKRSGFAALLDLGIAQGLLNDLGDVLKLSQLKLYEWWNADMIAEQKRLEAKRARRREQAAERQRQLERDRDAYSAHLAQLEAIEAARRAPIDGLVHDVLFPGDGVTFPSVGQYARVHYTGLFEATGEVFESTRKRGGALEFCVGAGHIIRGFDLVLQRMSVGETAKVTLAPMLAYGVKGRAPRIPPNATLVFKIELISVKEKLGLAQDVLDNDD